MKTSTVLFTLLAIVAVVLVAAGPVSAQVTLPWTEDFEGASSTAGVGYTTAQSPIPGLTGTDHSWRYELTNDGRLIPDSTYVNGGARSLSFDETNSGNGNLSINHAIATLDMSSYDETCDVVHLGFWFAETGDEVHANDRVWVRGSNTDTWLEVYDWSLTASTSWQQVSSLDVSNLLSTNGQSFSSTFEIRFGQEDNFPRTSDGVAFDDVSLTLDSSTCGGGGITLPWIEDFEGATATGATGYTANQNPIPGLTGADHSWRYEMTAEGRLITDSTYVNGGARSISFDDSVTANLNSTNDAIVTLDMSSYDATCDVVHFSYWAQETGEEVNPNDRVWVRGSDADTWLELHDWSAQNPTAWTQFSSLDVSSLLTANGQDFSTTTEIRLGHEDNYPRTSDGVAFDDLALTLDSTTCGGGGGGGGSQIYYEDFETWAAQTLTSNTNPIPDNTDFSFETTNGQLRTATGWTGDGTKGITFDYNTGFYTSYLVLTLDMTAYDETCDVVHLGYGYMHHGDEAHAQDRVWVRGSNSDLWLEIHDWTNGQSLGTTVTNPPAGSYTLISGLDVSALLAANTQSFTGTFQVRFGNYDTSSAINTTASDGVTFDQVELLLDSSTCGGGGGSTYTVGDLVFDDQDGDGIHDAGEPGVPGIDVLLKSGTCASSGPTISTSTTNASGGYLHSNVSPGDYCVDVDNATLPAGANLTTSNDPLDVTVTAADITNADFGYQAFGSISGWVVEDRDDDGVDSIDRPMQGVILERADGSCSVGSTCPTTTTAVDGTYTFIGVLGGSYDIHVRTSSLPVGSTLGSGFTHPASVTVGFDEDVTGVDFGYVTPDPSAPTLPFFEGFESAGNQTVPDNAASITGVDSRIYFRTLEQNTRLRLGTSSPITPRTGSGVATLDEPTPSLSRGYLILTADLSSYTALGGTPDQIYLDLSWMHHGEEADSLEKVWIRASESGNTPFREVYDFRQGTTAGSPLPNPGVWQDLTNLNLTTVLATYTEDYTSDTQIIIAQHDNESTLNSTVNAGMSFDDLCLRTSAQTCSSTATIASYVWEDQNNNTVRDSEPAIQGVDLDLYSGSCPPSGGVLATDTTDVNGDYSFAGLAPGSYCVDVVEATLPSGSTPTTSEPRSATVSAGETYTTARFGYIRWATVGDLVWNDLDGDGIKDAGEPGLNGVDVDLKSGVCPGTAVVQSATTNSSGAWSIGNLFAGSYCVDIDEATLPAGASLTGGSEPLTVALSSGEVDLTADFGYQQQGTIGDLVWSDVNSDGTKDAGEPGLSGVQVDVKSGTCPGGSTVGTATTNGAGFYQVSGLGAGDYCVDVNDATLPGGATLTTANDPSNVTLTAGGSNTTSDFGYHVPAGAGGTATTLFFEGFESTNGEMYETTSTSLAGAPDFRFFPGSEGRLRMNEGVPLATSRTPGTALRLGAAGTTPMARSGTRAATLDDLREGWGTSQNYLILRRDMSAYDANTQTVLLGYSWMDHDEEVHAGDRVWVRGSSSDSWLIIHDWGADLTDPLRGFWRDEVRDVSALLVANGQNFSSTFEVRFGQQDNYGHNSLIGGDGLTLDDIYLWLGAGSASIGDTLFDDQNTDGIEDASDPGVFNAVIELQHSGCSVGVNCPTTRTDARGRYTFPGLAAATYTVDVLTVPTGSTLTTGNDPAAVVLAAGETNATIDFGYDVPDASIGDLVFDDANGNGVQDGGETGLAGVTVEVVGNGCSAGVDCPTDVSDGTGAYAVTVSEPAIYTVSVIDEPTGYVVRSSNQGQQYHVAAGDDWTEIDYGLELRAYAGDLIWNDLDADGTFDAGETGLAGVTLELRDGICVPRSTCPQVVSDVNGAWEFTDLDGGNYSIDVLEETLPPDATQTAGADPYPFHLNDQQVRTDLDLGYSVAAQVSGRVFSDRNANGSASYYDVGLAGVTVELQHAGCTTGVDCPTAVTAGATRTGGTYAFQGLAPGNYTLEVLGGVPTGATATTTTPRAITLAAGEQRTEDFGYDVPATSTISGCFWHDENADGIRNGAEAFGPALGGGTVVVELYPLEGGLNRQQTTVDFDSGESCFSFTGVYASIWKLWVNNFKVNSLWSDTGFDPKGLRWLTFTDAAPDEDVDNDFARYHTNLFPLLPSDAWVEVYTDGDDSLTNLDFGYTMGGMLGDKIFRDLDRDGIQDAGEPGVPGVEVNLYDAVQDSLYFTTASRFDGRWDLSDMKADARFMPDVRPSTYYLDLNVPTGYRVSPKDQGGNDATDSDANSVGKTDEFTLVSNTAMTRDDDFDMGLYRACAASAGTIRGTVFRDIDANGLFEPLEPGMPGVTVTAYDLTNTSLGSTVTSADGTYSLAVPDGTAVRLEFTGLPSDFEVGPGGYDSKSSVQFVTAPACNADVGVNRPGDFCEDAASVLAVCYVADNAPVAMPTVAEFPQTISETVPPFTQTGLHTYHADNTETGSVYGMAYQVSSGSIFVSAFVKVRADMGPGGPGAIYRIDSAGNVTTFIDLESGSYFSAGYAGTVAAGTAPTVDYDARVYRESFGDLDISPDGQTLWTVNLSTGNHEVIEIPIGDPPSAPPVGSINRYPVPQDQLDCTDDSNDVRAFGLGFNRWASDDDKIYVGMTCTAASVGNDDVVRSYVYSLEPGTGVWTQVLNFDYRWPHSQFGWDAWVASTGGRGGANIADIEFDRGDMVLGMRKRGHDAEWQPGSLVSDILRACPSGPGQWQLENGGTCGSVTTLGTPDAETVIQVGPGGGEYYYGDAPWGHNVDESVHGGMAMWPGNPEVVLGSKMLHIPGTFSGGITWLNHQTGNFSRNYTIVTTHDAHVKSAVTGDIELACGITPLEIGNRVFQDLDGDGVQDPGEPGIAGVKVDLYSAGDVLLSSATTDADGRYFFVDPGSARASLGEPGVASVAGGLGTATAYKLRIDPTNFSGPLAGHSVAPADNGAGATADLHDSDGVTINIGGTNYTGVGLVTGSVGTNDHSFDFGFVPGATYDMALRLTTSETDVAPEQQIDFTIHLFNQSTSPASNLQVRLYTDIGFWNGFEPGINPAGNTGGSVSLAYNWAAAGEHGVVTLTGAIPSGGNVTIPARLVVGPDLSGEISAWAEVLVDDGVDVDSQPESEESDDNADTTVDDEIFNTGGDEDDHDVASVTVRRGSIGDYVWHDLDRDGVQEGGENGLAGVTVELYLDDGSGLIDAGDTLLETQVTDGAGQYAFLGLPAGVYIVDVIESSLPANFAATLGTGPTSGPISLAEGQVWEDADFGYATAGGTNIGDFIWMDIDADGQQDPGEVGIPGVEVTVTGPGGFTSTTTTGPDGKYLVSGLTVGGGYTVTVNTGTLPAGMNPVPTNFPTSSEVFTVSLGIDLLWADYGFDEQVAGNVVASIGDRVWLDANGDGNQDPNEPGLNSVTVDLLNASSDVVATMSTTGDGDYDFVGVLPGSYRVQVTDLNDITDGLLLSTPPNPINPVALAAGIDYDDADLGYRPDTGLGTVGNLVWHDVDEDGIKDANEAGVEHVWVALFRDNGNSVFDGDPVDEMIRRRKTDRNGNYLFKRVPFGTYWVSVTDDVNVLQGLSHIVVTPTGDETSKNDPYMVTLGTTRAGVFTKAGESDLTADFGYNSGDNYAISGVVWFDDNADGTYDSGTEATVAGALVSLFRDLDGDGVLDADDPLYGKTESASPGGYSFLDLPGNSRWIVTVDTNGTALDGNVQTTQLSTGGVEPVFINGANEPDHDFGFALQNTEAVVASFDAVIGGRGVQVEFKTASENGTVGFWLYRAHEGDWTLVNDMMVPAMVEAPQGSLYRVPDPSAEPGVEHTYWLLEIELNGGQKWHGPYTVTAVDSATVVVDKASAVPNRSLFDQLRRERLELEASSDRKIVYKQYRAGATADRVRLEVAEQGIQVVQSDVLAPLFGTTSGEIRVAIASGDLRVTRSGQQVAWWPLGDRAVGFYAHEPGGQFADHDVYFVELAPGLQATSETAGPVVESAGGSYLETLRFEEDVFHATAALRDASDDYWYWSVLSAGHPTIGKRSYDFSLSDSLSSGLARLEVELFAATKSGDNPDHSLIFRINGTKVGDVAWDGSGTRKYTLSFDGALLQPENSLEIEAVLLDGVAQSVVYLDGFSVTYLRGLSALGEQLALKVEQREPMTIDGFVKEPILGLRIDDPLRPVLLQGGTVQTSGSGYSYSFDPRQYAHYYVASSAALRTPVADASYRPAADEAEYLVFAPPSLLEAARRLADRRADDGLSTRVIDLRQVWDQYGDGVADPSAIRELLAQAWNSWSVKPRFAVLLGKGTLDYLGRSGTGSNLLPALLVPTPQGLYASDSTLGDVVGDDGVPEIAVGRIPVLSEQEFDDYMDKIASFESGGGVGEDRVVLSADNRDDGGKFDLDSEALAALFEGYEVDRIYLDQTPFATARSQLKSSIETGVWMVNYVGHGGLDRLAAEGLLTTADVDALGPQGRLPIMASLTCSAGRFELPDYTSLSEAMLLAGVDRGAIAVWAPTGQSLNSEARLLNQGFVRALREHDTIGEAILDALRYYDEAAQVEFPYMLQIYNLFGDPAMRIETQALSGGLFSDDFESGSLGAWSSAVQ